MPVYRVVPQIVVTGSQSTPSFIDPALALPVAIALKQVVFTVSHGGAVPMVATPQITAGTLPGQQELTLLGTSDTDYVIFNDGLSGSGLVLNGIMNLKSGRTISFMWTGVAWQETGRN